MKQVEKRDDRQLETLQHWLVYQHKLSLGSPMGLTKFALKLGDAWKKQ